MQRVVILALALTIAAPSAIAGRRCTRLRSTIYLAPGANVLEDGRWSRTIGEQQTSGYLSPAALTRFVALQDSVATSDKVLACLDALIAKETSPAAKRACHVHAHR